MSSDHSIAMSKNKIKRLIKNDLYIMFEKTMTQIVTQLKLYSERRQIINEDKWNRLIENTFHRNLRIVRKEIKKKSNYWNDFQSCINKFKEYIKDYPIKDEIEDVSKLIFEIWDGFPKFEIIILESKKCFIYIVFDSEQKKKIKKIGCAILSLRRRNHSSESDVKKLEEITKLIYHKYKSFPEKELLFYITPYDVNSFSFRFKFNILIDSIDSEEDSSLESSENETEISEKIIEAPSINQNEPQKTANISNEYEWVGKIIQSEAKPMRQGRGTKKVEDIVIEGWLYEKHCNLAQHNRYFIAQHPDLGTINDDKIPTQHRRRLLIKINDFKDWSKNVAHEISDDPHLGHFTQCWFNFEKFLDPDNLGSYKAVPVRGTGIDKYKFRDLTPEEYHEVYELPNKGVPTGLFIHDDDVTIEGYPITKIPFYFPVSELNYEQLYYTPTFIVGRPGSGKTNTLKALTASSLSCDDYFSQEKPAFIFFDYEGQFKALANPSLDKVGDSEDKNVWELLNITPVNYKDVKILSGSEVNPTKFSFNELFSELDIESKIKTIKYFLRTLSEVTEIAFNEISRKIFSNYNPQTYSAYIKEFQRELEYQTIKVSKDLSRVQRQALTRTLQDDIKLFFDQKGESFDLNNIIVPGKVIVFDLKTLPKEKTILYVLLSLQKLKLEKSILKCPVIVVIDEAHEIFKQMTRSSKEGRYYNLISKFLAEFGSRGRKYRLGLWLSSQRPQDLHKDIQKVIETYIILGLNPEHKRWLTNALGSSKNADFILKLPNKFALFKNSSLYRGKAHVLRLIKSPNVHRTFV